MTPSRAALAWMNLACGATVLALMLAPTWPVRVVGLTPIDVDISYVPWVDPYVAFGGGNFFVPAAVFAAVVGFVALTRPTSSRAEWTAIVGFALAAGLAGVSTALVGSSPLAWNLIPIVLSLVTAALAYWRAKARDDEGVAPAVEEGPEQEDPDAGEPHAG